MQRYIIKNILNALGVVVCATATQSYAYTLHIGQHEFELFTEKRTTPSINAKIQNNVYYVSLIPVMVDDTAHVTFNNTVYSACDISNDYCIRNGKLYWTHPDLYLKSSGTQYINTGIVPDLDTSFEINMADQSINTYSLFGVKTGVTVATETGFGISLENGKFGFFRNGTSINGIDKDSNYHTYYLSNVNASIDGVQYDFSPATTPISNQQPMYAFGFNHNGYAYDKTMYVKYIKIWQGNNTLIQHLVPVPTGLVIGNYTVPENGMFDIVSQTFFANPGVGKFQYGKVQ